MGREIQNEWDLGVKAACLAYDTMDHMGTGQTPFFTTLPVHWVYPVSKADIEMEFSTWTETLLELDCLCWH